VANLIFTRRGFPIIFTYDLSSSYHWRKSKQKFGGKSWEEIRFEMWSGWSTNRALLLEIRVWHQCILRWINKFDGDLDKLAEDLSRKKKDRNWKKKREKK